jgi:PTS system galactitol-specific IIC component
MQLQTTPVGDLGGVLGGVPAPVLLAVIVFLIALAFRIPPRDAAGSGLRIGVGFAAVYLVLGLAADRIAPAAVRLTATTPLALPAVDMGWPTAAAIAFGIAEIGFWMIPIFVVVNLALFAVGFTYTLDVDIHNYWHFSFIAGLVYVRTGNWPSALAVGLVLGAFSLVVADWTQPAIEETFDVDDVSIPHGFSAVMAVAALPVDALVRRTPVADLGADPETIQERLGALGEPVALGAAVGIGLGVGAYADALGTLDGWYRILELGVLFAMVMYLLPEVAGILMEGLTPLSEAVRDRMTDRFPDREFAVGLDSAILVGDQAVAAAGLLMIPIAVVMMVLLPGNELLWGVDLATFPFFFAMMAPIADRDVVRMVVSGTVLLVPVHYVATWLAPLVDRAGQHAGAPLGGDTIVTTGLSGSPANGVLALPMPVGLLAGLAVVAAIRVALARWPGRMYRIAGASPSQARTFVERRHPERATGSPPTPADDGGADRG